MPSTPLYRLIVALLLLAAAAARADSAADVQRLLREGDRAGALRRAEADAAANPQDAAVRFLQGVILTDLGQDERALEVFQRLTEDFPELAEPYNNIALLHARAGRFEAALAALQTALRNDPNQAVARQNLGDVHLQLALQAWQAAAASAPGDAALQRKLRLARELATPAR